MCASTIVYVSASLQPIERIIFQENAEEERRESSRPEPTEQEIEDRRQRRLQEEASNPYYLKQTRKDSQTKSVTSTSMFSSPDTPGSIDKIPGLTSSDKYLRQQKESAKITAKKTKKANICLRLLQLHRGLAGISTELFPSEAIFSSEEWLDVYRKIDPLLDRRENAVIEYSWRGAW